MTEEASQVLWDFNRFYTPAVWSESLWPGKVLVYRVPGSEAVLADGQHQPGHKPRCTLAELYQTHSRQLATAEGFRIHSRRLTVQFAGGCEAEKAIMRLGHLQISSSIEIQKHYRSENPPSLRALRALTSSPAWLPMTLRLTGW